MSSSSSIISPQTHGLELSADVPTMLFISGFPDSHNSFDKVYPHFEATHHVIVCVMPDHDKKAGTRLMGHSFPSIVAALAKAMEPAHEIGSPITLVGHDWGSYVSQRLTAAHPKLIHRLVILDVGYGFQTKSLHIVLAYQFYLAFAFLVSRIPLIGNFLGLIMLAIYPWKCIGPCPHEYNLPTKPTDIRMHHCYPYWQLVSTLLCDKKNAPKFQRDIPTLFLYGARKRAMFHSSKFLARLDAQEGCEWHELNCGHWMQTQKPAEVIAHMRHFLQLPPTNDDAAAAKAEAEATE